MSDAQPLYAKVKDHILENIRSGAWGAGRRVPSENELVESFGISRMTANRALREAKTLQSIEHSNIVAYVDVFLNMDQGLLQVCTVMEFCEHGNLGQLLHKTKQQGERSAPIILRGGRPAGAGA